MVPEKKIILRPISKAHALNDAMRVVEAIEQDLDKETLVFRLGLLNQNLLCQAGYYEEDPADRPIKRLKRLLQTGT